MGNSFSSSRIACRPTQEQLFKENGLSETVKCTFKEFFEQQDYQTNEIKSYVITMYIAILNDVNDFPFFQDTKQFLIETQEIFFNSKVFVQSVGDKFEMIYFNKNNRDRCSFFLLNIGFRDHATVCYIDKINKKIIFYNSQYTNELFFLTDYKKIIIQLINELDAGYLDTYYISVLNGQQINTNMCSAFSFFVRLGIIKFFQSKRTSIVDGTLPSYRELTAFLEDISNRNICDLFYEQEIYNEFMKIVKSDSLLDFNTIQIMNEIINLYNIILFLNDGKISFDEKPEYFLSGEQIKNKEFIDNLFFVIDNFYDFVRKYILYSFLFLDTREKTQTLVCNEKNKRISEVAFELQKNESIFSSSNFFRMLVMKGIFEIKLTATFDDVLKDERLKGERIFSKSQFLNEIEQWKRLEKKVYFCSCKDDEICPLKQFLIVKSGKNPDLTIEEKKRCISQEVERDISKQDETPILTEQLIILNLLPDYIKERIAPFFLPAKMIPPTGGV